MLSIVITTYNRPHLLKRAIDSALYAKVKALSGLEIIVIDDCSTIKPDIAEYAGSVKLVVQPANQGPQAARNRGIREAKGEFVLLFDDDDEIIPNSIEGALHLIRQLPNYMNYPVFQFATTVGKIGSSFEVIGTDHYFGIKPFSGDFTPIIQRSLFLNSGLQYFETSDIRGVGFEHLLWWEVADRFGIPTWMNKIVKVNADALSRLTGKSSFINKADAFARMQEKSIEFIRSKEWQNKYEAFYSSRLLAAASYHVVSGNISCGRQWLKQINYSGFVTKKRMVYLISFLPMPMIRYVFKFFR